MTVPVSAQTRDLTCRVYRALAIAKCKAAFCDSFPEAFKKKGKGFKKAHVKKLQGARMPIAMEA